MTRNYLERSARNLHEKMRNVECKCSILLNKEARICVLLRCHCPCRSLDFYLNRRRIYTRASSWNMNQEIRISNKHRKTTPTFYTSPQSESFFREISINHRTSRTLTVLHLHRPKSRFSNEKRNNIRQLAISFISKTATDLPIISVIPRSR